jgi:beta-glucosidase
MANNPKKIFPKDFMWGASTASHQVEGGNHNQWTIWEELNADDLARTAKKRLGYLDNWEKIEKAATDPDNYISGAGVDHYNRYEQDFDILGDLNLTAYRFGVEWSRIEPEEGLFNQEALDHYRKYISELKKRGIEPVLNIWHWTMPKWFTDKGGFASKKNLKYFDRFVEVVGREFGPQLRYVITLNEPNVYASFSYLNGQWPPQIKKPLMFIRVYWNLAMAHRRAYAILKRQHPSLMIGIAHQLANIQAKRPNSMLDEMATKFMRYWWNWWFINRIRRHQDFLGLNYYFTDYYTGRFQRQNPKLPVSDLGWYMEPEGLYPLMLRAWAHYKKPILITENGLADMDDTNRRWWIEETIVAMERALSEGVDLRGYFHWSLLDNFEWAYGWWPKFGLVEVDRKDGMKRKVRPSAKWFAGKIKELS